MIVANRAETGGGEESPKAHYVVARASTIAHRALWCFVYHRIRAVACGCKQVSHREKCVVCLSLLGSDSLWGFACFFAERWRTMPEPEGAGSSSVFAVVSCSVAVRTPPVQRLLKFFSGVRGHNNQGRQYTGDMVVECSP